MKYDYSLLFEKLIQEVRSDASFQNRMLGVIAECEAQCPHPDWNLLRKIDFDQDVSSLHTWLVKAFSEASLSTNFKGLWFGLSNPVYSEGPTADIYVAASPEFESGDVEWACNSTFYPEEGPLHSKVLEAVYRIAYDNEGGLANNAEYPLVLAYGAMVAEAALEQVKLKPPFNTLVGAAVGFDSGDLLFLGEFSNGKFICNIQAG